MADRKWIFRLREPSRGFAVSSGSLTWRKQYWVTYAFLTVVESAINAVYWFPFYYVFKFVLVLWMALPQTG